MIKNQKRSSLFKGTALWRADMRRFARKGPSQPNISVGFIGGERLEVK